MPRFNIELSIEGDDYDTVRDELANRLMDAVDSGDIDDFDIMSVTDLGDD